MIWKCDLCANDTNTLYECWFSVKWLGQKVGLNQLYRVCQSCARLSIPYEKRGEVIFTEENKKEDKPTSVFFDVVDPGENKTDINERKDNMCSYVNLIEESVDSLVDSNKMFTAFDITKEVKAQTSDRVYHNEVKKEVHKYFGNGMMSGYTRSLANLPGVNPQPWVYHPMGADVSEYKGTPVAYDDAQSGTNVISSVSSFAPSAASKVYRLDTTDRLCIPNKLVRQLGASEGWALFVHQVGQSLSIRIHGDRNFLTSYQVDKDDNIRVTGGTLRKAGLTCSEFEIDGNSTEITVKAAN